MSKVEPQTDRELLIQVNSDVQSMKSSFAESIDRLRETIDRLALGFQRMEEQKINVIQRDVDELKSWRQEMKGVWKLTTIIWVVGTAIVVWFLKKG